MHCSSKAHNICSNALLTTAHNRSGTHRKEPYNPKNETQSPIEKPKEKCQCFSQILEFCRRQMCTKQLLSYVQLFSDPMDCSPPGSSMGFPRQEYWSGLPFPSPGDLLDPGIEPTSSALQADSLPLNHRGNLPLSKWATAKWTLKYFICLTCTSTATVNTEKDKIT